MFNIRINIFVILKIFYLNPTKRLNIRRFLIKCLQVFSFEFNLFPLWSGRKIVVKKGSPRLAKF